MALIDCYECKGQVSTKALACPHCGAPSEVVMPSAVTAVHAINPVTAATVAKAEHHTHLATYGARAYFTIGGLIAAPIGPLYGSNMLLVYLAQYLLLGLGIALMAFGLSRVNRDTASTSAIFIGWTYSLVMASAIVTANIARFT